jgi:protoporphyrinogen oxidase
MSIVIVGGGVTGLTVALQSLRQGEDVVVLEAEPVIGGLCRSYHYGDFSFDVGPHRLFSADRAIEEFFVSTLGDAYVDISRLSQVKLNGHYHDWPLGLKSVFSLSPRLLVGCALDLFLKKKGPARPATLEDYVLSCYGKTIYEVFWKDYTRKFIGLPCDRVDAEWGALSISRSVIDKAKRPDSLCELVRTSMLHSGPKLHFRYPTGGMGAFPEALATLIEGRGGKIHLGQRACGIKAEKGIIREIRTDTESYSADRFVWTAPLTELTSLLGHETPDVRYLDLLLLNVEIEGVLPGDWQWVYFPDKRTVFSRISRPSKFDAAMSPPGMTGLCIEVSLPAGSPYESTTEGLTERVYDDLIDVGFLRTQSEVRACHIERFKKAYPIYSLGFRRDVDAAQAGLVKYRNLHPVGRQAKFEHDNIDEAVASALDLCSDLQTAGAVDG